MTQEQLEATLVDRAKIVARVYDLIRIGAETDSKHHILLVGPRGIGKSHLTTLIYYRLVSTEALRDKLAIAYLREDEWGLTSVLDLLIRIHDALSEPDSTSGPNLRSTLHGKPTEDAEQTVWRSIHTLLGRRSLLLIAENLDTVLHNIGIDGQKRLRAIIQTYPVWHFLATSTTVSADLSTQQAPFYGFFDLIRIEELTINGATTLLRRLAAARGDTETESFIASPIGRARVRAIQHLAGGNSRIFVLFYDLLQRRSPKTPLDEYILEPLQKTIDALTPYYQAKMAALSPLQQKIILYLCLRRIPTTVTAIANESLSSHQTIASQLKQLLANRYVRVNRLGRESYYELTEPLMRICIEAKSHDREPLRVLVEFLRFWFYREELEAQLNLPGAPKEMKDYVLAALREYDSASAHNHLDDEIARLCNALSNASDDQEASIAEELATVSRIKEDWSHCVLALSRLDRVQEIVPSVEKALQQHPDDVRYLLPMGSVYSAIQRYDDALIKFQRAIELDPKSFEAWYEQGLLFSRMKRYEDAINSFDTAIRLRPKLSMNVLVMKAHALMHLEKPEAVLKTLRPLLRHGKHMDGVFALYGGALAAIDRHNDAIEYLQKSVAEFPDDPFVRANLGVSLSKIGKGKEGLVELKRAHEEKPGNKWIASQYCSALFAAHQYDRALEEIPQEIVAHRIFHRLLSIFNEHPRQGALQVQLKEIESTVNSATWKAAFLGALTEFVGFAAENASGEEVDELAVWQEAAVELYGASTEYEMFVQVLSVLLRFKRGGGLRALLSLPLEQRRLLVSEEQEEALAKG